MSSDYVESPPAQTVIQKEVTENPNQAVVPVMDTKLIASDGIALQSFRRRKVKDFRFSPRFEKL